MWNDGKQQRYEASVSGRKWSKIKEIKTFPTRDYYIAEWSRVAADAEYTYCEY